MNNTLALAHRPWAVARLALVALACWSGAGYAATVTYDWVNNAGSNGVGSITFNSASITNPANFTNIPLTAVTALSYKWTSGALAKSITLTDVTFWNLPFNFSASGGFLTTQFVGSDFPTNSFSLQGAAFPAPSLNSLVAPFTHADSGVWEIQAAAPVPAPATLVLFAAGAALLGRVGQRRRLNGSRG